MKNIFWYAVIVAGIYFVFRSQITAAGTSMMPMNSSANPDLTNPTPAAVGP